MIKYLILFLMNLFYDFADSAIGHTSSVYRFRSNIFISIAPLGQQFRKITSKDSCLSEIKWVAKAEIVVYYDVT